MKLILTNLPAFYKINLYNEVNKHIPIKVIYSGIGGADRNKNFFEGDMEFEHVVLHGSLIRKVITTITLLINTHYDELIIGGWENPVSLIAPFFSPKSKNSCFIESSAYESKIEGLRGLIKKIYISRIFKVYASGNSQKELALSLGFKGKVAITGGCGILNYIKQPPFVERKEVKDFLYVGRLSEEKGLSFLLDVFNELPELRLKIIGFGVLEEQLRSKAKNNIEFLGAIDNKKLPMYYQSADVFILPSKSEPWGLVIEEALNNGTPVIVSDRVGCRETLVTDKTGLVFQCGSPQSLKDAINKIRNIGYYNSLRHSISELDFNERVVSQVKSYIV